MPRQKSYNNIALAILTSILVIFPATFHLYAESSNPLELRLRIEQKSGSFQVRVSLPEMELDAGPYEFNPPIQKKQIDELRWYLEDYLKWPVGPPVKRAGRIEKNLHKWGKSLFDAVFTDREALGVWIQFRTPHIDRPRLLTIDSTDPEVLRLPWELMANEDAHLFALDITLRRRVHKSIQAVQEQFRVPVRVLMVISRPKDSSFIDPRASAKVLTDVAESIGKKNAEVEFLWPPTLKALNRRLRDPGKCKVHVLHFDGHGVYDMKKGLGYLLFEDEKGKKDLVDAERLGNILAMSKVPLVILDACQSAQAGKKDPFTSVAPRLIKAGVGSVVAMQYSVMVETSQRFFAAFYRALAQGSSIGQSMFEGRRTLMADSKRKTIYHPSDSSGPSGPSGPSDPSDPPGGEINCHLKDWFLPALYQQAKDSAPFAKAVLDPGRKVCKLPLFGNFPETRFKFTGRSKELWELERFLRKKRVVILHGFGGQGKTAIACEASRWLTRTGMFDRALFISFEEGGDAEWAAMQMGQVLQDEFSKLSREEQLPALKKALSQGSCLVVWDNFESLLPKGNAELPGEELRKLLNMGLALTEDNSAKLLITTRDRNLRHEGYEPSQVTAHMGIEGFRLSESLEFAGNILDELEHPRPDRPDLERLLEYLGGHPLSIQLVVPKLKDYNNNVKLVIDEFENLYPDFKSGKAKHRNESLDVSLSFSLNRLSDETKKQMTGLGVFEGRAMGFAIAIVCEIEKWNETGEKLMGELEGVGLVKKKNLLVPAGLLLLMSGKEDIPQEMFEKTVPMPFYKFHPTLAPYLRARQTSEERKALEERYRKFYYVLSLVLYKGDSRAPHETRIIAQKEMPNLRHALDITMKAGETDTAVKFAETVERFLNYFGRWRERDTMMKKMVSAAGTSASGGPLTKTEYLVQSRQGELLWQKGRAKEAEQIFRGLLARMDIGTDYDGVYDRALTLDRLGRCMKSQGRTAEAETEYSRALDVLAGMDQKDKNVRRQTGAVHTDLADILSDQGRYSEAREHYEASLKIYEALGDKRGSAVNSGQLGTLAMLQGDYDEARQRYKEALNRFKALGETQSEAILWHQLAMVAEKEAERTTGDQRTALLTEAEKAYKESLRLEESIGNNSGAGYTAGQLAILSYRARRYNDAELWHIKAKENFKKAEQQKETAMVYNNLADLLLNVHKIPQNERPPAFANRDLLSEAEQWAHQAREIRESIGDFSVEIWKTYGILANIAEALNNPKAVSHWRKKERKAYAAFPGHWAQYKKIWIPQIAAIRKAVQGDSEAKETVAGLLENFAQTDDWKNLAVVLGKVLSGERDAEKLADAYNLDVVDYLILVKVLEGV